MTPGPGQLAHADRHLLKQEAEWESSRSQSHDTMLDNLSRIRLLTNSDTAEAARRLHEHNYSDERMVQTEPRCLDFQASHDQRRNDYWVDRDAFIALAQSHLHIKR